MFPNRYFGNFFADVYWPPEGGEPVFRKDADSIVVGSAFMLIDDVDVGYTKGGIGVRYVPEFSDVPGNQTNGLVRKARSGERLYVKTQLLEPTLERIRIVFGIAPESLDGDTLTLGRFDNCGLNEHEIKLTGRAPGCGVRTFILYRCIVCSTAIEYMMRRDAEVGVDVEFEALKRVSDGKFGVVIDS